MALEVIDPLDWTETTYRCTGCGSEDSDRSHPSTKPPVALNCYSCKAGNGKTIEDMIRRHEGMFPVELPTN